MLFVAVLLLLVVFCLFMSERSKKPAPKPSKYDSVFYERITNIKKIDSVKPILLERKYHYQKKARAVSVSAKANIALYKQSVKDGDTSKALEHIDSVIHNYADIEALRDSAQSYSDSIIGKQSAQIAAYEGLLTMTRTELKRLDSEVQALKYENEELKEKAKKRRRLNVLLSGIILSLGYLIAK